MRPALQSGADTIPTPLLYRFDRRRAPYQQHPRWKSVNSFAGLVLNQSFGACQCVSRDRIVPVLVVASSSKAELVPTPGGEPLYSVAPLSDGSRRLPGITDRFAALPPLFRTNGDDG